jgi:intracellular sulfur oxidation DsrE/DsrF family protein
MKYFIAAMLLITPGLLTAQSKPVKIVFDVTSKDTLTHQAVLRHVSGMAEAYPDALLEVVIYGGAWPMVVAGKTTRVEEVGRLANQKNVAFKICAITMERYNIEDSELVKGVEVVPDGIIEIVTLQNEGWGYIKESHN